MSQTATALGRYESAKTSVTVADINAQMDLARGREQSQRIRRAGEREQGAIVSAVGKAGVTMSGSARLAIAEAIKVNKEDALAAEFSAERMAMARRMRAQGQKRSALAAIPASMLSDGVTAYFAFGSPGGQSAAGRSSRTLTAGPGQEGT